MRFRPGGGTQSVLNPNKVKARLKRQIKRLGNRKDLILCGFETLQSVPAPDIF